MVICVIAAVVFGIMSIFSAKYRSYSKEAFNCVFRMATLRKCDTGFDEKIRAEITARTLKLSPFAGMVVYRYFGIISWTFVLIMLASTALTAVGIYNYFAFGNCNGPESTATCLLDPAATGAHGFSRYGSQGQLILPKALDGHELGNKSANVTIIEFGCFSCPYTKKEEADVLPLISEYLQKVHYVYKVFPTSHPYSWEAGEAAECASEQNKYWEYRALLFDNQSEFRAGGVPTLINFAGALKLNVSQFSDCLNSRKYANIVNATFEEGLESNVYGTPTFFINNETFVGYTDYNALKNAIDKELGK